jgi:hypothetical protein
MECTTVPISGMSLGKIINHSVDKRILKTSASLYKQRGSYSIRQ